MIKRAIKTNTAKTMTHRKFLSPLSCPSTGPKIFCAGTNFLRWKKNWIESSAAPKSFIPAQKLNLSNGNHLLVCQKKFGAAIIRKSWHKKFGPAQNILGPVEGRGTNLLGWELSKWSSALSRMSPNCFVKTRNCRVSRKREVWSSLVENWAGAFCSGSSKSSTVSFNFSWDLKWKDSCTIFYRTKL